MKTVKVLIGCPSLYHLTGDEARKERLDELRHELAGHFFAVGIHEGQLDGSDLTPYGDLSIVCDDKAAMRLLLAIGIYEHSKLGIKSVTTMFDTEDTSYDRMLEKLELAAARLTEAAAHVEFDYRGNISEADKFNTKTYSHLTGNTLSSYNSLRLLQDCCTDAVQEALNEGWRIMSVCPQEARRPDYILGRYDPHYNPDLRQGAAR